MFTIAACNYIFREIGSFDDFAGHVREVLDEAGDVDLVVLPELFTLELMTALPGWESAALPFLAETKRFAPQYRQFFEQEARSRGTLILAGSHLREDAQGLRNVAQLFGPQGLVAEHAKTHLFPAEFSLGVGEGDAMDPIDLGSVNAGINICYEAEIPECSAALVAQGVDLVLTPSLTFTEAGFWRVRHCVQSRCIENQVYSVHSCSGGPARGPFPGAFARSSIIAPCDTPWPANGVLAEAETNVDSVAVASIDLAALADNRETGAATAYKDRRRRSDRYLSWPSHIPHAAFH